MIPEKYGTNKQVKEKKNINLNLNFLTQIRSNQKKVEMHDLGTVNVVLYPSIYKAALALDLNSGVIGINIGKVSRNRCAIRVLTESES